MQVSVLAATEQSVTLSAPIEPNSNDTNTGFGGSAFALAILCAWSLLHVLLRTREPAARIVTQSSTIDYKHPITGPFVATSSLADEAMWARFCTTLERRKRARITLTSTLSCDGREVADFCGRFVASSAVPVERISP